MAVDEALAESCRRRACGPTLRLYGWNRTAISLGYFQRPEAVVDLGGCRAAGIPVVRRITGGRAVFHHHEVTYSVVAPVPHPRFPPTIRGTYAIIARALEAALVSLGLPVTRRARDPERLRHGTGSPFCFDATSRDEITLDGAKVVGSAQRRWPNAFLQHGSILLRNDPSGAASFFRTASPTAAPPARLCASRNGLTYDDLCLALATSWRTTLDVDFVPGSLCAEEDALVAESSHARDLTATVEA